jgi:Protein of unknown function (DUF4235)
VPFVKRYGWKTGTLGLGALAGLAMKRGLEVIWKAFRGSTPPKVAADRDSSWLDALIWAAATGVGVGVARLLAVRTAAAVWEATIHEAPPEPGLLKSEAA